MNDPPPRKATYDDLLQVPEHLVAEIINGRLVIHPRPRPHHTRASSSLNDELVSPFDKGRGVREAGGYWMSLNYIWAKTSFYPTSPAGVRNVCLHCRNQPDSS